MSNYVETKRVLWGGKETPVLMGPVPGSFAGLATKDMLAHEEGWEAGNGWEAFDIDDAVIMARLPPKLELDFDLRTIPFLANEQTPDRHGDVVEIMGGDFTDFRKNPAMPPFHRYDEPQLGQIPRLLRKGGQLRALAQFTRHPDHHLANLMFGMMWEREIRGFSIGFIERVTTLRPDQEKDGTKGNVVWQSAGRLFKKWLLLEISPVTIPAHGNALRDKDAGYLVSRLAEAIVGQNKDILDPEKAKELIGVLVQFLENQTEQPAQGEDPPSPPADAQPESDNTGEPEPIVPDEKQIKEVVAEAADYVVSNMNF